MKVFVRKISSSNRKSSYTHNWKVITEHYVDDKKVRKQIKSFKTKDEAEAFAKDHEKSIRIGRDYDFDMSLQEFYDNHIINWAYSHYKTNRSAKQILSMLDRFVLPRVGHKQLDKISINDWEQLWRDMNTSKKLFDSSLPDKPYAYQTILNVYMTCCKVFKEAQRKEKSISPTIWLSELPNKNNMTMPVKRTPFKSDEYKLLLEHLQKNNDRDYFFYQLLLSTGLRLGEALALTNRDLEFDTDRNGETVMNINVNYSITPYESDAHGFYNRIKPKSYTSIRKVFLPPKQTELFRDYLAMIDAEKNLDCESITAKVVIHKRPKHFAVRLINLDDQSRKTVATFDTQELAIQFIKDEYGFEYTLATDGRKKRAIDNIVNIQKNYVKPICQCEQKSDDCISCMRIFVKADGSQVGFDYYREKLKRLSKELRLPIQTIHGLRHTHATALIQNPNVSIEVVSDRLGHSSTDTTMNIYVTHDKEYEQDKAKVIDEIF